jgi:DNA (cytosine-5)-methyltransferase 1
LQAASFRVVGVDIEDHRANYCGEVFIQADALDYLKTADLSDFAFIWASPPCQFGTEMKFAPGARGDANPNLIPPTRELLERSGKPYVIENVEGSRDHLIDPIMLCGTAFGLETFDAVAELQRHRLFEVGGGWPAPLFIPPCQHSGRPVVSAVGAHFRNRRRPPVGAQNPNHTPGSDWTHEQGFSAFGQSVDCMNMTEICESIPPAYSKFIAEAFLRWRAGTALSSAPSATEARTET